MQEGNLSITTDLSGFGEYIKTLLPGDPKESGIAVVRRRDCQVEDTVQDIAHTVEYFMNLRAEDKKVN